MIVHAWSQKHNIINSMLYIYHTFTNVFFIAHTLCIWLFHACIGMLSVKRLVRYHRIGMLISRYDMQSSHVLR